MNTHRTSTPRPSCRPSRAAAMLVGAMLCAAPLASASAAETDTASASAHETDSLDLRTVLAMEQRRVTTGLMAWMGVRLEGAADKVALAHNALNLAVTFSLELDPAADDEEWTSDEESDDEEEKPEAETHDDSDSDESDDSSRRFDYAKDTSDPLAGL